MSAGVLLSAGVVCFLAASAEWSDRAAMVDPLPAEGAEQATFVLVMCAIGALNLAASLIVVLLRQRLIWWLAVGLQAAIFLGALVEGVVTDPAGWIGFSSLPLATVFVLLALRALHARVRQSVRQMAN